MNKKEIEKIKKQLEYFSFENCQKRCDDKECVDCYIEVEDIKALDKLREYVENIETENRILKSTIKNYQEQIEKNDNNIEKIMIVFENCETCTLKLSMFKNLTLQGLKTNKRINSFGFKNGEVRQTRTCSNFYIEINKKGLNQKCYFTTLEERLKENDITSVVLIYQDGRSEDVYVEWSEADEYENKYQKNKYTKENNIQITIEKC